MEHKLIRGGEVWLPFARSRVKALRALGLPHAAQSFAMPDGALVRVRIASGFDYIDITGGGIIASAFSCVQYPDASMVSGKVTLPGAPGATLYAGTFPATESTPELPVVALVRTRFGTSPYTKKHIRLTRRRRESGASTFATSLRYGVPYGGSMRYDVVAGEAVEEIRLASPFTAPPTRAGYAFTGRTAEFIPVVSASAKAVLAMLVIEADESYAIATTGTANDAAGEAQSTQALTRSATGTSRIELRVQTAGGVQKIDAAPLAFSITRASTEAFMMGAGFVADIAATGSTTWLNQAEPSQVIGAVAGQGLTPRRWHATERVSAGLNNALYVLRETNTATVGYESVRSGTSPRVETYSAITRGYTLSFVTPGLQVIDAVATGSIGPDGYIGTVIPAADGSKVYIHYGLHDASEAIDRNAELFLPVKFFEYLDIIEITKVAGVNGADDTYTFEKTKAVDLGAVTLRRPLNGLEGDSSHEGVLTDQFAKQLQDASLEVGGFIWASRWCYDVALNRFYELPDFSEFGRSVYSSSREGYRGKDGFYDFDTVLSPDYRALTASGRGATYYLNRFGVAIQYRLKAGEDGTLSVEEVKRWPITGGIDDGSFETLVALAAKFPKPAPLPPPKPTP